MGGTRYVASLVVSIHAYPFLSFILNDDSSNCTNKASVMRVKICPYADSSRFLSVLCAFHMAFGEIPNPYSASK